MSRGDGQAIDHQDSALSQHSGLFREEKPRGETRSPAWGGGRVARKVTWRRLGAQSASFALFPQHVPSAQVLAPGRGWMSCSIQSTGQSINAALSEEPRGKGELSVSEGAHPKTRRPRVSPVTHWKTVQSRSAVQVGEGRWRRRDQVNTAPWELHRGARPEPE